MLEKNSTILLTAILALDAFLLFLQIPELSISYHEASLYFNQNHSILYYILHVSTSIFGENDYALRLPIIFIHTFSALLFYTISDIHLKFTKDKFILLIIFLLIPGVLSSSLIVDESSIVILLLLFFEYVRQMCEKRIYPLMAIYAFISPIFIYIYLGTLFYASSKKRLKLFLFSALLLSVNVYLFKIDDGGIPTGHFLDALGLYAIVLSPIVFFYIVYVLYRKFLQNENDLLWYIITTSLLFSLLLSFRQMMHVELYAPYLLLALPISAQTFFHSYRVRLPRFRKKYKQVFNFSLILLLVNAMSVFFHKEMYLFLETPSHHFAYRMHVVKELSTRLKEEEIKCIDAHNNKMQLRLRFYGIATCKTYQLSNTKIDENILDVTIRHRNSVIYHAYVSKSYNL